MDSYFWLTNLLAAAICFYALLGTIFFSMKSRSHQEDKTLASSTLTVLPPPSSLPPNWKHQVFPSFHGVDVLENFLSHIVKEFRSKGINLFIENDIERSKSIGPELTEAIRGSRIAIVLLSKNYASSTWCLNELMEIIKCREEFGQTVMSIFYQVDPTDVKKQTGDFGKVFGKTCKGKTKEEIRRWQHALTEVAQIAGYHSSNWKNEAEMIEHIATDVSNKLNLSAPCSDLEGLVGMQSHMVNMGPFLQLDSEEVRKIGILGQPGIDINNFSHLGIAKHRLKDKKVLVVLDDVDRLVQVEAFAKETNWFGPGTRIIITTQDQRVLKASGTNHIHKVNFPSDDEALQMFCMYAFDQKYPKDGFKELACEVVSLVGRLPLGLKVMGSYFRGSFEQEWTEALPKLRTHLDRDGEIASILKFSYDSLCDEDKRLFLHIACFFNCEKVGIVEDCLAKCFSDVRHGRGVLAEKSLISINMDWGTIEMTKLLVQLGRKIVREQSVNEPGKRQFLNDAIEICEVLSDDRADSSSVIGINVETYEDVECTSERAFERLYNLQFLRILGKGVNPQSINHISQKLKVLIWLNSEMTCFPSNFNPKFLVKLEMMNSKLKKLWEETKPLNNLKWMNLSRSRRLEELPDLSTATNLYDLDLSYCSSLVKLPSSIGNAINLQSLHLSFCSNLVEIPPSIGNAVNIKKISLIHCSSLVEIPTSITTITSLTSLDISGCSSLMKLPDNIETFTEPNHINLSGCSSLVEIPSSIVNAKNLQKLDLSNCLSLVELPSSIGNAINLQKLNLSHCSSLVELPFSIGNATNLQELNLSHCSSLVELPSSIGNATNLEELNLSHCSSVVELPFSIGSAINLQKLDLSRCSSLVKLPSSIGNAINFHKLNLSDDWSSMVELPFFMRNLDRLLKCSKSEVLPADNNFQSINLSDESSFKICPDQSSTIIRELDPWIWRISHLRTLVLNGMKKLVSLPPLPDSLLFLDAEDCESLERLDCSFDNPDICLNFVNCFKLNQEARDLISLTPTNGYAVFPGTEVPQCFTYRSSGSSLTVKLIQKSLGISTKFKACILSADLEGNNFPHWSQASVCCGIIKISRHLE
ncbi:hypothetical protein HID58_030113 [Brassica napus]|uniref:ADP-ribosyl cyclase/cyclic ADP-ribose hydrolase n=1 Tax=Brassica napus TaxID=3708 RepID=A0ABQ8CFY9_BRANA|nr:hypothetical protein HID58_030113 [Brassica napus]